MTTTHNPSDARSDVLTESAPTRVWLQVDTGGDPDDRRDPIPRENWGDLTWCYESIGGQEVIYIRADLVAELVAADRAYDAASKTWQSVTSACLDPDEPARQNAYSRYMRAIKRRNAALARIKEPA